MTRAGLRLGALTLATTLTATALASEEIAEVGVDWVGNDIIVEAVTDPDIPQVTCYISYFERGIIDRLQQGNWFEDPSYSAIDCAATGKVSAAALDDLPRQDEIFSQRQSLIFKSVNVSRIYDRERRALIYLSHASEVSQGSGKMALSAVVPVSD